MKRNFFVLILSGLILTSCYNTRIAVGDVSPTQPLMKVNSHRNDILLWGLVPLNSAKKRASEFVGDRENYVIRTNHTFVNGLVAFFTFYIYTPTTTTYYIPIDDYDYGYNNDRYDSRQARRNNRVQPQQQRYRDGNYTPVPANPVRDDFERPRQQAPVRDFNNYNSDRQDEFIPEREQKAEIYYRNGGVINATILGDMTGEFIRLRLEDGQEVESRMSDIQKINLK